MRNAWKTFIVLLFAGPSLISGAMPPEINGRWRWEDHEIERRCQASVVAVAFCTAAPDADLAVVGDSEGDDRCAVRTASFRVVRASDPALAGSEIVVAYHHAKNTALTVMDCRDRLPHPTFRAARFPVVPKAPSSLLDPFGTGPSPIRFESEDSSASAPLYFLALDRNLAPLFEIWDERGRRPSGSASVLPEGCFRYAAGALMACNGRAALPPPRNGDSTRVREWIRRAVRDRDEGNLCTILWDGADEWRLRLEDRDGDLDDVLQPGPMRFFRLDAVVWMAGVPELLPLLCRYFYDNIPPDQVPQEDEWQRKRLGRILRSLYAPLGEGASIRIEWPDPVGEKAMISFRAEEREIGQIAVEKRLLPGDRFVWLPAPDPFFAP